MLAARLLTFLVVRGLNSSVRRSLWIPHELSKAYRNLESTSNTRIERLEFEKADFFYGS